MRGSQISTVLYPDLPPPAKSSWAFSPFLHCCNPHSSPIGQGTHHFWGVVLRGKIRGGGNTPSTLSHSLCDACVGLLSLPEPANYTRHPLRLILIKEVQLTSSMACLRIPSPLSFLGGGARAWGIMLSRPGVNSAEDAFPPPAKIAQPSIALHRI